MPDKSPLFNRRTFLAAGAASAAAPLMGGAVVQAQEQAQEQPQDAAGPPIVTPPEGKRILLSCKLGMIAKEVDGQALTLADRLSLAGAAGFDGVDLDEAGSITTQQAREAVWQSGVFVHNAINHAHWQQRFTSSKPDEQATALANLEHCIRVSHAAGGSGVLLVVGRANDGTEDEIVARSIEGISKAIPLAASLGQRILFENVWSGMFYNHNQGPEQSAQRWVDYIDAFNSPWIGMYHDIGNHWKYGNPADWIRSFGPRAAKFDVKGFRRKDAEGNVVNTWADIGQGDLPWDQVREALDEVGFAGWVTAEVGGGGLTRLTQVREQMQEVFGL